MVNRVLELDETPVWRIYKNELGQVEPVLYAWYTTHDAACFLTERTFSTKKEATAWLDEFWAAYWRLG